MTDEPLTINFKNKVIEDLVLMIEYEIRKELSVRYLSIRAGYSEGHLRRMFKQVKGVSLAAYIRKRKIEFAAQEIKNNKKFIVDISTEYGFSSQAAFSRAFKAVMGVTPKETRVRCSSRAA